MGIVYLLMYVPKFWFCKVGYTKRTIKSRVRGTSKAVWGFTIPIFFIVVPLPEMIEGIFHAFLSGLRKRFYKGDGSTETFVFPAHFLTILLMLAIWFLQAKIVILVWELLTQ